MRGRLWREVSALDPCAISIRRCFCKVCGTALGEIVSDQPNFPIAANALDADPGLRNRFHEFVAEKPAWYDICDTAKQFEGHPVRS
jgi:hypothetical protein